MTRYLSTADTAKLIRAQVKANWPGTKFTVRSHNYAGGSSIRVGWTDGPLTGDVDRVVGDYAGADFDGMIDLKTYRDSVLVAFDGGLPEEVRMGADFVFTERALSPELQAATNGIAKALGFTFNGGWTTLGSTFGRTFDGPDSEYAAAHFIAGHLTVAQIHEVGAADDVMGALEATRGVNA